MTKQSAQDRRNKKRWLTAAALWTLFIWSNSLRPADQSAAQSMGLLAKLMPWLNWTGLPEELLHTLLRKAGHLSEFAILGGLWLPVWRGRRLSRLGGAMSCCLVTALVDETIQLFVPGRAGLVSDLWIDAAGALLGCLVMWTVIRICRKKLPSAGVKAGRL